METIDKAINPKLLPASRKRLGSMRPVTTVDIYDGATKDFHPDGLFSTEIFGRVGSPERLYQMSFIDLKVKVFNPVIFKHIERLKGLYVGIMSGRQYAKWNPKLGDFERVNSELEGKTGFAFFLKHFNDIKFKKTNSDTRNLRIELIKKYEQDILRDTCVVSSAGSRDIIVGDGGRESRDEINDMYMKIIAISNTIIGTSDDGSNDTARWNIQRTMVEIYDYLFNLTFGKKKQIQGTFASRRVFNSTRNVITSMPTHSADLDSSITPPIDSVMIGLWQHTKASLPVTQHYFLKGLPSQIIDMDSGQAKVFDSKMQPKDINLSKKSREYWTTPDGINRMLNDYGKNRARRSESVMVEGQFFAGLYRDKKHFRIITATEVENGLVPDKYLKAMKPISWVELIYCLVYKRAKTLSGIVTRYPVTGGKSTYPAKAYLKTTTQTEVLRQLGTDFKPLEGSEYEAISFPVITGNVSYFDSFSPHPSSLVGLGADFDGDTVSWTCLYGDEAVEEQTNYLDTKAGYFDPAGGARLGVNSDLIEWLFRGMTLNNGL